MFAARVAVGVGEASYATLEPDDHRRPRARREAKDRWLAIFYAAIPVGAALGCDARRLPRAALRLAHGVLHRGGPGSARRC